jgi:ABC-type glycerol-3-phosphate transport system permease component
MSQRNSGLGNTHRRWLGNGMAWVALTLLGVFWMVPFLWMVSTSFKGIDEV